MRKLSVSSHFFHSYWPRERAIRPDAFRPETPWSSPPAFFAASRLSKRAACAKMQVREHFHAPTIRSVRRRRAVAGRPAGWSILVAEGTVMIALKNILVPTDFSDTSANAVRYAKAFAETF